MKIFVILIISGLWFNAYAQKTTCTLHEPHKANTEDFMAIKNFHIDKEVVEVEHSYVLTGKNNYNLVLCNSEGNKKQIHVKILDANRNEVANNFDIKSKKYSTALKYHCNTTGMYYIQFYCKQKLGCSLGVLAFKN